MANLDPTPAAPKPLTDFDKIRTSELPPEGQPLRKFSFRSYGD